MNEMAPLANAALPLGIRSRFVHDINGLRMHILEAGFESQGRPCVLLLHGFPELAYSWRKVMVPCVCGVPCRRARPEGYGRTTGWDANYNGDLGSFRLLNLVRDALGLASALGYHSVAAVVGHDFGSPVAAWCALARPDVFRSVVLMSAPFTGRQFCPSTRLGTRDMASLTRHHPMAASMTRWRSWIGRASTTNGIIRRGRRTPTCTTARRACTPSCVPTITTRARTGAKTTPSRLSPGLLTNSQKMPAYYIMDLDKGMASRLWHPLPSAAEIAACRSGLPRVS